MPPEVFDAKRMEGLCAEPNSIAGSTISYYGGTVWVHFWSKSRRWWQH